MEIIEQCIGARRANQLVERQWVRAVCLIIQLDMMRKHVLAEKVTIVSI